MKWRRSFLLGHLILCSFSPLPVLSANILCLLGVACPSHHFWNRALVNGLAARGHNVTVLSADLETDTNTTHYLHLDNLYATYFDKEAEQSVDYSEITDAGLLGGIAEFYNFGILGCKGIISSKGFEQLRRYPEDFRFDLILHDFTIGPCLLGFLEQFRNPPLVGVSPFNNPPFSVQMVGGHKQYAYVPHYLLPLATQMNLYERLINGGLCLIDELYRQHVAYPKIAQSMRRGFGRRFNDLRKLEAEHQLLLVNSHRATDFPESLPGNIIPVGGLHIQEERQELPKDVSEFLSRGGRGVIYFSIGSTFQGKDLHKDVVNKFVEAFRELEEFNVLWKFESEELQRRLPRNVMIRSWLPQNDLLADERVKVFISHAGLLSTHEAIYHGVPVLAIPLFSDQYRNAHKLSEDGLAVVLDVHNLHSSDISQAVRRLVADKSYRSNMQIRSQLMRDEPQRPLDRAIWWIEWVIRHPKGHQVFRPPTQRLGFWSANSWDILILVLVVLVLLPYVIISSLVFLGRCLLKRERQQGTRSGFHEKRD